MTRVLESGPATNLPDSKNKWSGDPSRARSGTLNHCWRQSLPVKSLGRSLYEASILHNSVRLKAMWSSQALRLNRPLDGSMRAAVTVTSPRSLRCQARTSGCAGLRELFYRYDAHRIGCVSVLKPATGFRVQNLPKTPRLLTETGCFGKKSWAQRNQFLSSLNSLTCSPRASSTSSSSLS